MTLAVAILLPRHSVDQRDHHGWILNVQALIGLNLLPKAETQGAPTFGSQQHRRLGHSLSFQRFLPDTNDQNEKVVAIPER